MNGGVLVGQSALPACQCPCQQLQPIGLEVAPTLKLQSMNSIQPHYDSHNYYNLDLPNRQKEQQQQQQQQQADPQYRASFALPRSVVQMPAFLGGRAIAKDRLALTIDKISCFAFPALFAL
jgi:hypothetical protein